MCRTQESNIVPAEKPMDEHSLILQVINLTKAFDAVNALIDVSFQVERQTITAVIGPYGSGKTTLLNVISGDECATSGKVLFEGKDISCILPHQASRLGIARTFQDVRPFHDMSVLERVIAGFHRSESSKNETFMEEAPKPGSKYTDKREKALEILKLLNLTDRKDELYSKLPYRDKKRLELARVLGNGPKLILLDEPTAGLPISETWEVIDFILKMKESGRTVLLVEHDLDMVMQVADRIVVLHYGKKLLEGTPSEIRNDERVIECCL
jgi:branched-chain amino acid transport system ATP-binding protein